MSSPRLGYSWLFLFLDLGDLDGGRRHRSPNSQNHLDDEVRSEGGNHAKKHVSDHHKQHKCQVVGNGFGDVLVKVEHTV